MAIVEFTHGTPRDDAAARMSFGGASLEIDLLKTLVAIVETGSFNRAAKAVYRTPSAVSMQMKRLEELIGRPIFTKDGRGVTLTGDGDELLGYSRRILALADEALLRFRCATTEGIVRLGTPDDYAAGLLPAILARFAKTHPLVQIDVTCHPSYSLRKMVDDAEIDIALVDVGCEGGAPHAVHREKLVWAGLRDGLASKKRPLPLAVSFPTCSWRRHAMDKLDAVGIPHRIAYTSYQYMGQLSAVLADLAIAPFAASSISGDLIAIEDPELPSLGYFEIDMRLSSTAKGPAVEALAQHIRQGFSQLAMTAAA